MHCDMPIYIGNTLWYLLCSFMVRRCSISKWIFSDIILPIFLFTLFTEMRSAATVFNALIDWSILCMLWRRYPKHIQMYIPLKHRDNFVSSSIDICGSAFFNRNNNKNTETKPPLAPPQRYALFSSVGRLQFARESCSANMIYITEVSSPRCTNSNVYG